MSRIYGPTIPTIFAIAASVFTIVGCYYRRTQYDPRLHGESYQESQSQGQLSTPVVAPEAQQQPLPQPLPSTQQTQLQPQPLQTGPWITATIAWSDALKKGEMRKCSINPQKNDVICRDVQQPVYISKTPVTDIKSLVTATAEQTLTCQPGQSAIVLMQCPSGELRLRESTLTHNYRSVDGVVTQTDLARKYAGCFEVNPNSRGDESVKPPIIASGLRIATACIAAQPLAK